MPGCVRGFAPPGAEFRPVSPPIDFMLVRPKGGRSPAAEAFAEIRAERASSQRGYGCVPRRPVASTPRIASSIAPGA